MAKLYLKDLRKSVRKAKRTVSHADVVQVHTASGLSNLQFVPLDTSYVALPAEIWELFLEYSGVDRIKYKSDTMDCDDFAQILCGECKRKLHVNGIGLVVDFSGGHAYNALLAYEGSELSLLTIEPQNDKIIINRSGMYAAQQGFLLL